jgi:flavin-dependent dehydrogenase
MQRFKVVVIGAGPAGAYAAHELANAGLHVALIDRPRKPEMRVAETLSPEATRLLAIANLWKKLPNGVAEPCPAIVTAWRHCEPEFHSFITNPYGCAWHIDRARFDAWLVSEAGNAGAFVLRGATTAVQRHEDWWEAGVRNSTSAPHTFEADYLVLATGRSGCTFNLGCRRRLDSLCLVGGWTMPTATAGSELLVEAVADGWWYSAPFGDRLFAGLITEPACIAGRNQNAIERALARAPLTRSRLASSSKPHSFGAVSSHLSPSAGSGWIAIGDAALGRDPLSGDGLAHAFRSAREGARTILCAVAGDVTAFSQGAPLHANRVNLYLTSRSAAYRSAGSRWPAARFWKHRWSLPQTA